MLRLKSSFIWVIVFLLAIPAVINAQTEESVYLQRKVVDESGEALPSSRSSSDIAFTVYLNNDLDSVLTEDAPRWDDAGSNWNAASSVVGIELQNFYHFNAGDTAFIRFTDLVTRQRGNYHQSIDTIPWTDPSPFDKIQLESTEVPSAPQEVSITLNKDYERSLSWNAEPNMKYWIYRKSRNDVIFNGSRRNLYTLQVRGLSDSTWTDPNTSSQREFSYIIYAVNDEGIFSPHSQEVSQEQPKSETSVYFKKYVNNADGDRIDKTSPDITFTAFLNNDQDKILLDNAPRLNKTNPQNVDPVNGMVGVELQIFPHFEAGDTAHIRVTDNVLEERGAISQKIDTIPWSDPNPLRGINLSSRSLPSRPRNVELSVSSDHQRTITWESESDLTYRIYRRNRNDTLFNGIERRVYTLKARGLTSGSWTDPNTSSQNAFGYVVYASNSKGTLSAHSREVVRRNAFTGLQDSSTTPKNVSLSWDPYQPVVSHTKVAGYNVYRRTEDGSFGPVEAYTGPKTHFTDSRLQPGKTYYYKVVPRDLQRKEIGKGQTIQATTRSSGNYTSYMNLNTAVVIYTNTNHRNGGDYEMPESTIPDIKKLLDYAREFYWRNTEMQFNFEFDYIIVDEYKNMSNKSARSTRETGQHLAEDFGVVNTQYDFVFRIAAPISGYWSWGATNLLGLPGPERETGFSHLQWPLGGFDGGFDAYPSEFPQIDVISQLIWLYIHEGQHAIDGIYNQNGHPEMGHGDFPWIYGNSILKTGNLSQIPGYPTGNYPPNYPDGWGVRFGKRFDFQATMLRDFKAYKDLSADWGEVIQSKDRDGDGMPDQDNRVPIDESTFGTDPTKTDTDGDGYSDKQEAIDGIYHYSYSDPRKVDTDRDGLKDGQDPNPRYPMKLSVKQTATEFSPAIDGNLDEWPAITRLNDTVSIATNEGGFAPEMYMAYNRDTLFFGIRLSQPAQPSVKWDFGADGRYYGSGNTHMVIDAEEGTFTTLRTWDASEKVKRWLENNKGMSVGSGMWDNASNYQAAFGAPVFDSDEIVLESGGYADRGFDIEMAIPKNSEAGLELKAGKQIGLIVNYSQIDNVLDHATTFDQRSYEYVTLCDCKTTDIGKRNGDNQLAKSYSLEQNYPNPFNPTTTIAYSLPEEQHVTIKVYNVVGRQVAALVSEKKKAGSYRVTFDAKGLSSGIYYYRIRAGTYQEVKKMLLVK